MTCAIWRRGKLFLAAAVLAACSPPPQWPDSGTPPAPKDSGVVKDCRDNDGDGYRGTGDCSDLSTDQKDCNDTDAAMNPAVVEVCDGIDNNCNFLIDEGLPVSNFYVDLDNDGYGAGLPEVTCQTAVAGKVKQAGDCEDTDVNIHPGAQEFCNGKDDDCNGTIDDDVTSRDYFTDTDGDGFGTGAATPSCLATVPGKAPVAGDCNDADPSINPGATEVCNGKDDNCSNSTDETFPGKGSACLTGEQGVCQPGTKQCVSGFEQCVHNVGASAEICDNLDNDCNGTVDETFTAKGTACTNGLGVCARAATYSCGKDGGLACAIDAGPPTAPSCDGLDNNCDGVIDEFMQGRTNKVAQDFEPTALDLAPLYLTPTSCNGGNAASGTDSWYAYYAAFVKDTRVYIQQLREDGDAGTVAPTLISDVNYNYVDVGMAQGGPGMVVAAQWMDNEIHLIYVGPGPTLRTLTEPVGPSQVPVYELQKLGFNGTVSNVRVVRANQGNAVVLWWQDDVGGQRLWMARMKFAGSGTTWAPSPNPPLPIALPLGNTIGPRFGAASNVPEYGDSVGCPGGMAKFAVAYKVGNTSKLMVFNEDGTATSVNPTLYTDGVNDIVQEADVAWAGQVSAGVDRWAAAFTVAWAAPASAQLFFWQTGKSPVALATHTGAGATSVQLPNVAARPTEFLLSALIAESGVLAAEPQAFVGKMDFDGGVRLGLTAATYYAGCPGPFCTGGTRRLVIPASSSGGTFKTDGFILYGSSSTDGGVSGHVNTTVLTCN